MFRYVLPLFLLFSFYSEVIDASEASWKRYVQSGQMAFQRGRLERAEQQFTKALESAEEWGEQYPHFAISLSLLGEVCRVQGKYLEALGHFERAVALGEKSLGKDNPEFSKMVINFAKSYRAQGMDKEADNLLSQYALE